MKVSLDGTCPALLHLSSHLEPDGVRLELRGELDVATAHHLVHACQDLALPSGALLRLDLAELKFLDAAGLHALHQAHLMAIACGHRVQIHQPRPLARRILALTGLDTVLDVHDPADPSASVVSTATPGE